MPSGENLNFNSSNPEASANTTPRSTYQERGQKPNQAVIDEQKAGEIVVPDDLSSLSNEQLLNLHGGVEARQAELNELIRKKREALGLPVQSDAEAEARAKLEEKERAKLEEEARARQAAQAAATTATAAAVANSATAQTPDNTDPAAAATNAAAVVAANAGDNQAANGTENTTNTTPDTAGAIVTNPNTITSDEAQATLEKAKKQGSLKKTFKKVAMVVLPIALAAITALTVFTTPKSNQPTPATSGTEIVQQVGENQETLGIKDGYDEYGMWLSENKSGPLNFACATEAFEACENDEKETIKYTAENQVESFADYLSALPRDLQPDGFKGISLKECETKLEGLSDEEFSALKQQFDGIMDSATVREKILNGTYKNAYMRLKDPSGKVMHENMEVVGCTTKESNYRATEFVWYDADGNEAGSMVVKIQRDADGNIIGGCCQVVEKEGESNRLDDLPTVEDDQDKPTPDDEKPDDEKPDDDTPDDETPDDENPDDDTPDDDTPPGWGKEGDTHAGDLVEPSDLVDPSSEVSEEKNKKTNQGNQGYVDDQQATPGSSSDNNKKQGSDFSPVIAPGANTDDGRLKGGEDQSGGGMAGENKYQDQTVIEQGKATDRAGNNAQSEAQSDKTPGGDNFNDAAEEEAVRNGDF